MPPLAVARRERRAWDRGLRGVWVFTWDPPGPDEYERVADP